MQPDSQQLSSVKTWNNVSQYFHNGVSNVFHFPTVNQRIKRGIEKHER